MKKLLHLVNTLPLLLALPATGVLAEDAGLCKDQAEQILARLQTEVVGELNTAQRASANQIVLDVCLDREQQVEAQVEQAVQQVRDEEQAKSTSWWSGESADKPGNKRLKSKSH
jgi:hypothetical protein